MTDDDLRAALLAADPARSAAVEPVTGPRARELMEHTMRTDPSTTPTTRTDRTADRSGRPATRRSWLVAAAAAAVVMTGGGTYLLAGGEPAPPTGASATSRPSPVPSPVQLTLSGALVDTTASCPPFSEVPRQLTRVPIAFAGTVTGIRDGEVHLTVTRWYRGGDATTVVLRTGDENQDALQGPVGFETGADFLLAAGGGEVSRCGMSGPADPVLQAAYDEAFGA